MGRSWNLYRQVDELDELEEVEIKIQHAEKDQTAINNQLAELEARLAVLDPSTQYAADITRELQARIAKLKTEPRHYPFKQAREREALIRNQGAGVHCQSGKARVDISAAAKDPGVIASHYSKFVDGQYRGSADEGS
jgi:chromosome segregation ATPase